VAAFPLNVKESTVGYHTECICIRRGGGCVLCNDAKFDVITQLSGKTMKSE